MTTGACRCESCCTELAVRNRPGLSTISYRVDEFSGFRRALLRPLEGEEALHGWHPTPGDLGLQVLEWWAYLGDVLTFYNERIANEDYLRTAELSASVSGLVALLGYTPRPAIAAAGKVAAIRSRSRPAEPLVVPAGMQLASSATPGIPSQTFEAAAATFTGATDGPIVLPPSPGLVSPPRPGESGFGSVLLRGSVGGVAAGDDVLIVPRDVETAKENWTELTVLSVSKESDPNGGSDTRVLLSTEYDWWAAYAQAADARLVKTTRSAQSWTPRGSGDPVLQLDGANLKIRLASIERALPLGEVAFLDFGADGLVPVVPTATQEEFLGVPYPGASGSPPSPPNIPLLHTVVTAETPYAAWLAAFSPAGLRFGLRDVGAPVGAPATTLASLPVTVGNPSGLAVAAGGAEAFAEDANGNGIAVLATTANDGAITLLAGDDTAATFSLAAPLRLDLAVVDVTRGATVAGEQLGTGDASVGGQTFALKKSPLTYLAQGAAWKSTLSVAVDSLYWTEVASFYAQLPDAKVFVVSQRPDGKSEVRFGDGTNGARLPTGGKVVATYRYGAGAASPPAGRLTTILKPQPNLASLHDPVAVWGGADAQQPEDVRTNAPASVLTFGRAISADDYEAVAGLAPGVSRVRTYWTWDAGRQRALVKVYVGDDASAATSARAALTGAEDPNRPVLVVQATPIELAVACTIEVAPDHVADDVRDAATTSLADAFAPALMGIGRPLYTSELESALSVPGVVAVHALSATAGGADVFSAEPVGFADPGEGSFYVLSSSSVTAVTANA